MNPPILEARNRLQEVLEIGHRATVMRDGRTVQEFEVAQVKEQDLVVAMVGQHRSLVERLPRKSAPKEVAFQVDCLEGPEGVQERDFAVRSGEIVGLAGLNGSGRTTFLKIIFGDLKGRIKAELFGKPYAPTWRRGGNFCRRDAPAGVKEFVQFARRGIILSDDGNWLDQIPRHPAQQTHRQSKRWSVVVRRGRTLARPPIVLVVVLVLDLFVPQGGAPFLD